MPNKQPGTTPRSRKARAVSIISMLALLSWSAGCQIRPRVVVIPADHAVGFAPAGSTLTLTNDTYLVGVARMQWILRQLAEKERALETSR